jgi:hypothetical protein
MLTNSITSPLAKRATSGAKYGNLLEINRNKLDRFVPLTFQWDTSANDPNNHPEVILMESGIKRDHPELMRSPNGRPKMLVRVFCVRIIFEAPLLTLTVDIEHFTKYTKFP